MTHRPVAEKTQKIGRTARSAGTASRFRPPRMLFLDIERPYLISKLMAGLARQIVVLRAPPGYGKSALMSAAYDRIVSGEASLPGPVHSSIAHCSWLSLPSPVSEEAFVADLRHALDLPAAGDRQDLLGDAMDAVAGRDGITVLFIEDVDNVASDGHHPILQRMALSAPDNLRIACSSFFAAPLPVARLKARGVLSEMNANELGFGQSELRRLLTKHAAPGLADSIMEVTRGWPALTQLAAAVVDASRFEDERETLLAGNHPDLAGFIRETVLNHLSPSMVGALQAMASFDRFRLDLAADLASAPLSPGDLAMLEALHPVVQKEIGGWLSFHPVLRACLRDDAAMASKDGGRTLHRRAASWFATRGLLEEAVSHAVHSGDLQMAEEIIGSAGGVDIFLRAGRKVLEQLIDNFPPEALHASPGLTVCYAVVLSKRGNVAAGRERLNILKDDGGSWSAAALAAVSRNVLDHIDSLIDVYEDQRMGIEQAERLEAVAASLAPHATWELAWLHNHLCIIYTRLGHLETARRSALKALGYYREEKTVYAQIFMLVHLGLVDSLRGEFSAALQFSREAEELAQSVYWTDRNLLSIAKLAAANVHYLQGNLPGVEQTLSDCVEPLIRGESWVDLFTRLFSLLAQCRLRVGSFDSAIAAIDKAEEVALERALPRLKLAAGIMRMGILVHAGMIESAVQASERVQAIKAAAGPDEWTWREVNDFQIASARLALAQNNAQKAMLVLETLIAETKAEGQGYHQLIAEIIAAHAAWKLGRHSQALSYLQSAIARARTHEATQPFIDEGQQFAATLRAIVGRFGLKAFSVDAVEFMSRIVGHGLTRRSQAPAAQNPRSGATSGLLSEREATVLKLLAEDYSNKEIARLLRLSEATVKFHLKNIYAKLGVGRRAMAVSVCRKLNLLKVD